MSPRQARWNSSANHLAVALNPGPVTSRDGVANPDVHVWFAATKSARNVNSGWSQLDWQQIQSQGLAASFSPNAGNDLRTVVD